MSDAAIETPAPAVEITREMREIAWTIAQERRAAYAQRCDQINARFRALKDQRMREHDQVWDRLRDRREFLRLQNPRPFEEIRSIEEAMKAHKAAPLPTTDDLEADRVAACMQEDRVLAAELDELRRQVRAGELPAGENYV